MDVPDDLLEDLGRKVAAADKAIVDLRHAVAAIKKQSKAKESARPVRDPRGHFDLLAEQLDAIYPHGWTNDGRKRPPGLKRTASALRSKISAGYTEEQIRRGVEAFAQSVGRNSKYSPALCRWVEEERWREVRVKEEPKPPTPEELEETRRQAERARAERIARNAEAFGVDLSEPGNAGSKGVKDDRT